MADNAGAATDAAAGGADAAVSDASATSGQAAPMSDAPAQGTEAQRAEAGLTEDGPSEEARQVALEDAQWRLDNPEKPRMREANPAVGGEDNSYLRTVSEGVHPDNAPEPQPEDDKDNG